MQGNTCLPYRPRTKAQIAEGLGICANVGLSEKTRANRDRKHDAARRASK